MNTLNYDSIRILTWNLHKQTHPGWRRDFHHILDQYRPHILNLQEARTDIMLTTLSERAETWCWMAAPNLTLHPAKTEVGVFTAMLAPLHSGSAMLSEGLEPLILSRKAMLRCKTPNPPTQSALLCLNIHSLNFKLGLAGFRDQLAKLLEAVEAHQGPVVLSGDFNSWSPMRTDLLLRMTESLQLRQVKFAANDRKPTWRPRLILDHVFYSQHSLETRPGSARILNSIRSSDHAPLLVDFQGTLP